jgi:hypothetical protein
VRKISPSRIIKFTISSGIFPELFSWKILQLAILKPFYQIGYRNNFPIWLNIAVKCYKKGYFGTLAEVINKSHYNNG